MIKNLSELGENLQSIVKRLLANQTLVKYLYYTSKDPLSEPDLTSDEIKNEIYQKLIKIVPKIDPQEMANSIIALKVERGLKNSNNSEFKDILLKIEVLVPITQWFVKSDNLRPFIIMGEIQKTLEGKTINGLGKIPGGDFAINFITEEMTAYEMSFRFTSYD